MKKTITIVFLSFVCSYVFSQPIVRPDTLSNAEWELLDGPHGDTNGFTKSGNRLYALPNFYSDDLGENWKPIPDFQDLISVIATDDVVFYINAEQQFCGTSSNSYVAQFYRSTDGGETLDKNLDLYQSSGRMGWTNFSTIVKNDRTLYYFYRFPLGSLGSVNYSNDAGETWQNASHPLGSQYSSFNDTIVSYNQPPDEKGTFYVFGNDDLSNPIIDSVYNLPDAVGSFLYVDGQYFVMSGGKLNVSKDRCQTWTEFTVPYSNPGFKYFEGSIYFSDSKSLYRFSIDNPSIIDTIYTSSFNQSSLLFGLFDDVFLINDFDGVHRSMDDGATWEQKASGISNASSISTTFYPGSFQSLGDRLWLGFAYKPYIHRSSVSGNDWEILFDSIYYRSSLIGAKEDFIFLEKDGVMHRSNDSGATWQQVLTNVNSNDDWWVYDDKIYFGNLVSTDDGATWQPSTFVSDLPDGQLVVRGDTLIKYWQNLRNVSIDKGVTWVADTLPRNVPIGTFISGDTLVYFTGLYYPTANYSTDGGYTWKKQFSGLYYNYYLNSRESAKVFGFYDGVLIAHSLARLYITGNFEDNWKTHSVIPFGTRIKDTGVSPPSPQVFIRGADQYLSKDGYLYAYTNGKGIWRTSIGSIANSNKVEGKVFSDKNDNCQYDEGIDIPLPNIPVQVGNGLDITDQNGDYCMFSSDGTYPISALPAYYNQICPLIDSVTLFHKQGKTTIDFPLTAQTDYVNLKVSLSASRPARPGFNNTFRLTVINIGAKEVSDVPIIFKYNQDHYQFVDASGGNHQDGEVTFISSIPLGGQLTFEIELRVLTIVSLGTLDVTEGEALLPEDIDQRNNRATLVRTVIGSYDPNDKTAMPRGNILPFTENEIEYLIRFQNVGTDTAFNVSIIDKIAPEFNLKTLEVIDASHDYKTKIRENREVIWEFENILLVDSFANEPLSHGYIHFSIKTDSTLSENIVLENQAAIYFDFNLPVITNETQNEVKKGIFEELNSYEICKGEMVNGQFHYQSTFISDTIVGISWDSIFSTDIEVYPVYSIWKDINWNMGDTFQNVVITSDTLIIENHLTAFGCDSTITTNLIVITSSSTQIENLGWSFTAYPNPFKNELNFEIQSKSSGDAQIQIFDVLGRLIYTEPIHLIIGENLKTINTTNLSPGILTAKISNSVSEFQRVQILKDR